MELPEPRSTGASALSVAFGSSLASGGAVPKCGSVSADPIGAAEGDCATQEKGSCARSGGAAAAWVNCSIASDWPASDFREASAFGWPAKTAPRTPFSTVCAGSETDRSGWGGLNGVGGYDGWVFGG